MINLQLKMMDTTSATQFIAKLGISALARLFQYVGKRLTPHTPSVVKRTKLARKCLVLTIWNPPQAVATTCVRSDAKLKGVRHVNTTLLFVG